MDRYTDRQEAGLVLAQALSSYTNQPNTLIFALPRGGVPIAYEIAKALHLPLDVFIARKLGVPGHEELAMGAIAMDGTTVLNDSIIRELFISSDAIKYVTQVEQQELERRAQSYRANQVFPNIQGKTIIVVDDGIATGATMRAVIKALKNYRPAKLIIAIPVAEKSMCEKIATSVDQFICPLRPLYFNAVGSWYTHFDQVSDEEVISLLKKAQSFLTSSQKDTS